MDRRLYGTGTGLDAILSGGLRGGKTLLVFGAPGSGKTLLGLSFLNDGIIEGDRVVYVSFSSVPISSMLEPAREMKKLAPLVLSDDPMFYPASDLDVSRVLTDADRIVLDHPEVHSTDPGWMRAFGDLAQRCREQGSATLVLSYSMEPLLYHSDGVMCLSRVDGRMKGVLMKWPYSGGGEACEAEAGEWMG